MANLRSEVYPPNMDELAAKLQAAVAPSLAGGEDIVGVCIATQVGVFRGRAVAIATTAGRLLIQGLDRRLRAKGEPLSLTPAEIEHAAAGGAGGGWADLSSAVMDRAAVKLELRTASGKKLKLMLMRGVGPLAGLEGGETQREGVDALASFLAKL